MFHGNISLNSLFLVGTEFCDWVPIGIYLSIQYRKCQIKPHLSLWFSVALAALIAHGYVSFHMYQNNKYSASKAKFRQASNHFKKILKAAKFDCANKTKETTCFRNLALVTSDELLIVFSQK